MTSKLAEPAAIFSYDGQDYESVKEGLAEILHLKNAPAVKETAAKSQSVFYNPIQQFNRDLSVLAIRAFGEDLAIIRKIRKEKRSHRQAHGGQRGKKRKRDAVDESGVELNGAHETEADQSGGPIKTDVTLDAPLNEVQTFDITSQTDQIKCEDNAGQEANPIPKGPRSDTNVNGHDLKPTFRILDALSATGLRALRYAKEVPMASSITANDLSSAATASIKLNVQHNGVESIVKPTTGDARAHMYNSASSPAHADQRLYQVIDLDPYGTAAPFFDAAVQALADGGLLCVTCTDAGVFASAGYLEKTFSQYGGLPFKGPQSHEGGLRLILHAIATSAARYGIAIEPLLSLSIDFYARLFVRIKKSPAEVKFLAGKTMVVYNCDAGCGSWTTQFLVQTREKQARNGDPFYKFSLAQAPSANQQCEHCGFKTHLSGPMWGGPLHNPWYIQKILDMLPSLDKDIYATIPRIEGMLTLARDETILDVPVSDSQPNLDPPPNESPGSTDTQIVAQPSSEPFPSLPISTKVHHSFFLIPSQLASIIHCISPSDAGMRGALLHLGYRTTRSHTKPGSIVTDAPWDVIWEVMREYARQKAPIKEGSIKPATAGWAIMAKSRERREITLAKAALAKLANGEFENVEALKKDVEGILYGLGKPDVEVNEAKGGNSNSICQSLIHTSKLTINFDEDLGKERNIKKMVRYQVNPRPDWGPMNKASG
ncbi:MAG: hypothetical protein Q9195_009498 [Heterodermia aff. obscurata]